MTWEERYAAHLRLGSEHSGRARKALKSFRTTGNVAFLDEYKAEIKEASKHWGIAKAMNTKKLKRLSEI